MTTPTLSPMPAASKTLLTMSLLCLPLVLFAILHGYPPAQFDCHFSGVLHLQRGTMIEESDKRTALSL